MAKKLTIEQVCQALEKEGYKLTSNEYKNIYSLLSFMCPKGHVGQTRWKRFKKGQRCWLCKKEKEKITIDEVRKFIEERGYRLLSTEYINCASNLDYLCPNGHRGQKNWNCFKRGLKCPKCRGRNKTIDEIKMAFEKRKYTLLSQEYEYSHSKLHYICPNQHEGQISWDNFKQGHGCPKCKEYKGETQLGEILEELFLDQVKRQDNLGFLGQQKVDYSVRNLRLAFEYDGEQHFRPTRFIGVGIDQAKKNFKVQQKRDKRKDGLCKENGYLLIRIPYHERMDKDKIKNRLLRLGV